MSVKTNKFGEVVSYVFKEECFPNDIGGMVSQKGFPAFSPEGISSYLTFRHPIGDCTMFDGYRKIPFGSELVNGMEKTFWYPAFGQCDDPFDEAVSRVESLIRKSIGKIIEGKSKIAVTLSGGVDSSLIVGMLRAMHPEMDIYTYSAGFYGDDEFEYSRFVAKQNGTVHKEKILSRDDYIGSGSLLRPLIRFKGSPLHPNELALASIELIAKEDGCDCVLCGEGSDDIFGGYGQNLRMYMNYDHCQSFFSFFLSNYRYFSLSDRSIINSKYLVDDCQLLMQFIAPYEIDTDIRDWALYFTQKMHTPGLITRGANALRYNGFSLGFPYINDELVSYANSLPFEYKIAWKSENDKKEAKRAKSFREISEKYDIPKFILKKVAEKYLDKKIIYRAKKGFPVPFDKWLGKLNEWDLDKEVFISNDISRYNGWKKFMIINLDAFLTVFNEFKR